MPAAAAAGQRTHGTTFRAPAVSTLVATTGAESAVYDCLAGVKPFPQTDRASEITSLC